MARVRKVEVISAKPSGRWEIDPEGFKKACKELGIDNPQNIRVFRTSRIGQSGRCSPKYKLVRNVALQYYHITANKYADKDEATRIMLHELRHVWQHQQCFKHSDSREEGKMKWHRNCNNNNYLNRPIEIDARKAEKRVHEFPDLVRMG